MYWKTKYNLWKIKKSLSPNSVFKGSLQKELNQAWDAKYGKVNWLHSGVMYRAGAMLVVIVVLVGSGGAYAYNSPDVTEGNILYPVKKAIEKVEEVTRITPEAKANFFLKKIERREAERVKIKKNKVENQNVELEPEEVISTETRKTEFRADVQRTAVDKRIEKIDRSIEKAEDRLEKFNENFKKDKSQSGKLQEEVKNKIEKRLEKRKDRLEKALEIIQDRNEELKELEEQNRD